MGTISIQNITTQIGEQIILADVSLELHTGEIVGIVGPNGSGKTTLFRLITGALTADMGTVTRTRGMQIGYLPQEPQVDAKRTLHDEVLSTFEEILALEKRIQQISEQMAEHHAGPHYDELVAEYEKFNARFLAAGGYNYETRLNEILGGLGFAQSDLTLPVAALSGGQKCRAALAKLLLQDASYLLLDEPTNHLDIDAVRWLEKFLAGHHGGAAIISHDRYLLDRLADRIVEVEHRKIRSFPGNYSNYAQTRELRRLTQLRQYEHDRALVASEREFIAKHLAGQRTREAQGRRKRLERRIAEGEFVVEKPLERKAIDFDFDTEVFEGRVIIETSELAKRYDEKVLFAGLSLEIAAGQRFGITGPNGTGKTTLFRILRGKVDADEGQFRIDQKSRIGYYAQEAHDLDPDKTVIAEILDVRPSFSELAARNYLARYLFTGEHVFKRTRALSGGEQSRLRFAKLILRMPNVLLLDEPTNHLDIPAREALEATLAEYPGTIIAISHDRYFLDKLVNRLLVMRAGTHGLYKGNYSHYIREVEAQAERAAQSRDDKPRKRKSGGSSRRGDDASKAGPKSRWDRMSLSELEAAIIEREERLCGFEVQFSDPEVYQDGARVAELRAEFEEIQAELTDAEAAWERRAES